MKRKYYILFLFIIGIVTSCENNTIPSLQTDYIKSVYAGASQVTMNSFVWANAPYFEVPLVDISNHKVNSTPGELNTNGGYDGIGSFDNGKAVNMTLRSVYTNDRLYILAEWQDSTLNVGKLNWFYNGPSDPNNPGQSALGWTSQNNDDKLVLKFDFPAGQTYSKDVWEWSAALSDPLGYAIDMVQKSDNSTILDEGTPMYVRNAVTSGSGPAYEFDTTQLITKPDGSKASLDEKAYLLNKTPFIGDAQQGVSVYNQVCAQCHSGQKPKISTMTRKEIKDFIFSDSHEGQSDVQALSASEVDNAIAYIRGYYGVPGFYLQTPSGSVSDVWASSNISSGSVGTTNTGGYTVMLSRKLDTGNSDDVKFDTNDGKTYNFSLYLYNADSLNYIGIENQRLTFKKSKYEN